MTGILYVVSTPIGNLEDITIRALRIFKEVDVIAAEDTRRTRILLNHYGITTPVTSYYEYNKRKKGEYIIALLKEGKKVALVSDAGTPGISDPGFRLVEGAHKEKIPVVPIPGASAIVTALSISGLPSDRFIFEGFLSNKKGKRNSKLHELKDEKRTIAFYESPHRIINTLKAMLEIMGDREILIGRELTKKFEEVIRGKISYILRELENKPIKGEFTVVLKGYDVKEIGNGD